MRRKTAVGLVLGGVGIAGVASAAASGGLVSVGAGIASDVAPNSKTIVALGVLSSLAVAFAVGAALGEIAKAVRDRSGEPDSASASDGDREVEGESRTARPGRSDGGISAVDPDADVPKLLSDEEHVVRLLEANDGRLGQSEIVSLTPWSKSKVSRLLARMDARGEVVKVSTGRRNAIFVPGEEPAELKPPEKPKRDE